MGEAYLALIHLVDGFEQFFPDITLESRSMSRSSDSGMVTLLQSMFEVP